MLVLIKKYALIDPFYLDQFTIYLNADILKKIGLIKKAQPLISREKAPREKSKIIWISIWISVAIILLPLLVLVTQLNQLINNGIFFADWLTYIN